LKECRIDKVKEKKKSEKKIVSIMKFGAPIVASFPILPASHNRKIESNIRKISRRECISIENIVVSKPNLVEVYVFCTIHYVFAIMQIMNLLRRFVDVFRIVSIDMNALTGNVCMFLYGYDSLYCFCKIITFFVYEQREVLIINKGG
jgi:hypothetical protein